MLTMDAWVLVSRHKSRPHWLHKNPSLPLVSWQEVVVIHATWPSGAIWRNDGSTDPLHDCSSAEMPNPSRSPLTKSSASTQAVPADVAQISTWEGLLGQRPDMMLNHDKAKTNCDLRLSTYLLVSYLRRRQYSEGCTPRIMAAFTMDMISIFDYSSIGGRACRHETRIILKESRGKGWWWFDASAREILKK